MTNTEIIATIRNEIERRIETIAKAPSDNGVMDSINGARGHELMKLLSFLSTLESEKPMNQDEELNEEIKRFIEEYGYERGGDRLLIAIVARHFAQWGAEHLANSNDEVAINGHELAYDKDKDAVTMKPVPNDLEEYASRAGFDYVDNIVQEHPGHRFNDHDVEFAYRDGIIAGAKWQKEQDQETIKLSEINPFLAGVNYQKEQMMKDAVEGEITKDNRGNNVVRTGVFNNGFEIGDKVRIIIVKED